MSAESSGVFTLKEINRVKIIQDVIERRITTRRAAEHLGISDRQCRRLLARYRVINSINQLWCLNKSCSAQVLSCAQCIVFFRGEKYCCMRYQQFFITFFLGGGKDHSSWITMTTPVRYPISGMTGRNGGKLRLRHWRRSPSPSGQRRLFFRAQSWE